MITIHKLKDEDDGLEYIDATEVFKYDGYSEFSDKGQEAYFFIDTFVIPVLHYYHTNTSTAFGNPDLARYEGMLTGYCIGKGWDIEETREYMLVTKGKRKLYYIEKPCLPDSEIDKRKDIRDTWNNILT